MWFWLYSQFKGQSAVPTGSTRITAVSDVRVTATGDTRVTA